MPVFAGIAIFKAFSSLLEKAEKISMQVSEANGIA
jgi:hypothetical protein